MAEISVSRALTFLDENTRGVMCVVAAIQFSFPEKVEERKVFLNIAILQCCGANGHWTLDKASQLNVIIKLNPI